MSTTQVPTPTPGNEPAIELSLAQTVQYLVSAWNTADQATYAAAVAQYALQYGTEPNASAPPPPAPPEIGLVDSASVEALEAQANALFAAGNFAAANSLNWGAAVTFVQAPVIPLTPPVNTIVIGGPIVGAPAGFYSTMSGDVSQVPNGFSVTQNGQTFKAVHVGFMGAVWWQLQTTLAAK